MARVLGPVLFRYGKYALGTRFMDHSTHYQYITIRLVRFFSSILSILIEIVIYLLPKVFHILTQFSAAVTYNMFITLGLITAVPVSAGNIPKFIIAQFIRYNSFQLWTWCCTEQILLE